MEKPRKKAFKGKIALRVILFLMLFLVILAIVVFIAINVMLNKMERIDPEAFLPKEEEVIDDPYADMRDAVEDPEETVYPELDESEIKWNHPNQVVAGQDIINLMLIGQDRRPGEDRARSDSMIVVSINQSTGKITMVSFLRDLYVQIPGYPNNRLNAAYRFGGMELLDQTIEENFGIQIDGNFMVDFNSFQEVIDAVGGVDIELTDAEAEYMNLPSGLNHMDGETALSYSRIRYLDSDFGRTNRQRNVLTSVYKSYKNLGITGLVSMANKVLPLLSTDLTNSDIISMAYKVFPMIGNSELQTYYVPYEGTYEFRTINEMAVIVPDFEANQNALSDLLMPKDT